MRCDAIRRYIRSQEKIEREQERGLDHEKWALERERLFHLVESLLWRSVERFRWSSSGEAVRSATERMLSISEAARQLGIGPNLLRKWRQALEAGAEQASPEKTSLTALEEENLIVGWSMSERIDSRLVVDAREIRR